MNYNVKDTNLFDNDVNKYDIENIYDTLRGELSKEFISATVVGVNIKPIKRVIKVYNNDKDQRNLTWALFIHIRPDNIPTTQYDVVFPLAKIGSIAPVGSFDNYNDDILSTCGAVSILKNRAKRNDLAYAGNTIFTIMDFLGVSQWVDIIGSKLYVFPIDRDKDFNILSIAMMDNSMFPYAIIIPPKFSIWHDTPNGRDLYFPKEYRLDQLKRFEIPNGWVVNECDSNIQTKIVSDGSDGRRIIATKSKLPLKRYSYNRILLDDDKVTEEDSGFVSATNIKSALHMAINVLATKTKKDYKAIEVSDTQSDESISISKEDVDNRNYD